MTTAPQSSWHDVIVTALKDNDVRIVPYVPDRVFTPLIQALHADRFFTTFACTREEEAIGIVSGAWMGGVRSAVLMQTSGFATIPNVLASLVMPCQFRHCCLSRSAGRSGNSILDKRSCAARCALSSFASHRTPYLHPSRSAWVHPRPVNRTSRRDPAARDIHPVGVVDGWQGFRGLSMGNTTTAHNAKIMNRFELTKRFVAHLEARRSRDWRHR